VKPADTAAFRAELLQLVDEVDGRWDAEQAWHSPQGCWWSDFSRYPTVGKYLAEVRFFPRSAFRNRSSSRGGQHWLTLPLPGGAYSEDSMVAALKARLADKIQKYAGRPGGLDEFDLLVHYDLAWEYNSPVETLTFKFAHAARAGAEFIAFLRWRSRPISVSAGFASGRSLDNRVRSCSTAVRMRSNASGVYSPSSALASRMICSRSG
jgi:hypothetical protein